MALYFKETEITNIDNFVPQSGLDITDMWFGTMNVYTVWAVYEGTLPATLNANGDDMRQYQIYGNTGGVGDKTVNFFDESKAGMIRISPTSEQVRYGINFGILPAGAYTICFNRIEIQRLLILTFFYSDKYSDVNITYNSSYTFTAPEDAEIIIRTQSDRPTTFFKWGFTNIMLTEGTTPPENYVPYGYEVDISTSDGTNTATTPIYIGNTALQKDEYIDYEAGKVYRRTENELDKRLITNNHPGELWGDIPLSVKPSTPYTLKTNCPRYNGGTLIALDNKTSGTTTPNNGAWNGQPRTITSTSGGVLYVRYRGNNSEYDLTSYSYMLTEGTTPPETYVPYLQPTDPPVPLPALPTCEGTTIVDYAGSGTVPEKVLLKYRKENF